MDKQKYIGQKYGNLKIADYISNQPKGKNCKCICSCGNITWARYGNLQYGNKKSCGCKSKKEISKKEIGKKYNCLEIIDCNKNSKNGNFKIRCDCGNMFNYNNIWAITKGLKKTCSSKNCRYHNGLSKFSIAATNQFKKELENTFLNQQITQTEHLLIDFKNKIKCAKKGRVRKTKTLEFDLTEDYIQKLYIQQNGRCNLSKIQLNKNTASLDRINSNKGYIEGNVQWVHSIVNTLKLSFDQNYFINTCKNVSNYQKNKTSIIEQKVFNKHICKANSHDTNYNYKGELKRSIWNAKIIKRSIKEKIFVDPLFTPEDAENIFFEQNGICALSGVNINLRPISNMTASLDRINSFLGYSKNNVQWVHKDVNFMKSKLNNETFILFCSVIDIFH